MRSHRILTAFCIPAIATIALLPLVSATPSCVRATPQTPQITARWSDNFDRAQLGSDWYATNGTWTLQDGTLHVADARNHPLWLRRRLPRDARIEFDAWSESPDGDIKCEVYGNGRAYATQDSYTATSYVVIFGGWRNSINAIARMNEHGSDRQERRGPRVVQNQHYHWSIERHGNTLSWSVDGAPMLEFNDSAPLAGPGHEYFAFNNWMIGLGFDNLVITPL